MILLEEYVNSFADVNFMTQSLKSLLASLNFPQQHSFYSLNLPAETM